MTPAETKAPLPESVEALSRWMVTNGYATGHGETVADLIRELDWQHNERMDRLNAAASQRLVVPLPQNVEMAVEFLVSQAVGPASTEDIQLQNKVHEHETILRAHIAAMADDIELYRNTAIDLKVMLDKSEKEIERLRGANKELHQHVTFYHRWATADVLLRGHKPEQLEREHYGVMRHYPLTLDEIEALAPKQPEPCKTDTTETKEAQNG